MRTIVTGILATLAIALLAWPLRAETAPVPIVAANAALAIPGVETAGARLTAVHLWAIWCVPCLKELPELDATATIYKDKGLRVTAIALDTDMAKVEAFFKDKAIKTLTPSIDKDGIFRASHLKGLPGTLFFNTKGELIARADGPLDWQAKSTREFLEENLK